MKKYKHRVEMEVPPKDVVTLKIGGYTFFRGGTDSNQLQCATCLCLMSMQPISSDKKTGEVRRIKVVKDCDCPPQK
jgi:hypothetical protein